MKNILILTDFSNNAYNALLYAVFAFKSSPCKFYLVHSFEDEMSLLTSRVDIGKSEQVYDQLFANSELKLNELKRSIIRDTPNYAHTYELVSSSRPLTTEVNYLIKGMAANVVIMGTKGVTGAKEVLLGSNAINVIKKIKDCPLLIVPDELEFKPIQKIGFATGFQHKISEVEFHTITSLLQINDAKLFVLHVYKEEEKLTLEQHENLLAFKNLTSEVSSEILRLVKKSTKTETILDFIKAERVDLLAMIYYKHGFLKSLFRESVIKKVGRQTRVPYLMIPSVT